MTNHDTELAREIADVFYKATINYPELMNSNWGMNLERAIEQALRSVRQESYEKGRREENEAIQKIVGSEPELPGDMPDEMWFAIRNDRDACQKSHKLTVKGTKQNIITAISNRLKSQGELKEKGEGK